MGRTGLAGLMALLCGGPAGAGLLATNGAPSSAGAPAEIVVAPADVTDDGAHNLAIQAFDEVQAHVLAEDLAVDGGVVPAGTTVDSHMIFLNTGPGDSLAYVGHGVGGGIPAEFTFTGRILGVMSRGDGLMELASTPFLGAPGTRYPTVPLYARGLEPGSDDYRIVASDTIRVAMRVSEPGDWIRVITASAGPVAGLTAIPVE